MKIGISILTLFLMPGAFSYGQAVPAGGSSATPTASAASSGFGFPSLDGTLHYALNASEIVQYGYYGSGNASASAVLSGDIAYSSTSVNAPFNMLFAGGVILAESGQQNTTTYENLAVSQGLISGKWVLGLSDSVSFLPQSPTTGLSGIAGVGDIGAVPIQGPSTGPAGGILTYAGSRLSNSLSGNVERLLTGKTSISGTGTWTILHFLHGNDGFDSTQVSGQAGLNHRIDARDSVSVNGVYSVVTFGANEGGLSFTTQGINGLYSRILNRTFSISASAGPQWVSSSNSALIPSSLNVAATAGLAFEHKLTTGRIGYSRGVNAGSGVQLGGLSDTVSVGVGHPIGRDWLASGNAAFTHTSSLATNGVTPPPGVIFPIGGTFTTAFGGVQVSHRLGRTLSMYGSYGLQHQTHDAGFTGTNAFDGTSQTFGIGISFTPRSTRLGQF